MQRILAWVLHPRISLTKQNRCSSILERRLYHNQVTWFAALGGSFGRIRCTDHNRSELHRIDAKIIEPDLKADGFVLEAPSDVLRNPENKHQKPMNDAWVRGRTTRLVMRFGKD